MPQYVYTVCHLWYAMAPKAIRVRKRILRWGNSYGLRLTRKELEGTALREGVEVEVELRPRSPPVAWDRLPQFRLGRNASREIDEVLAEGYA